MSSFLNSCGYTQSKSDYSLFVIHQPSSITVLLVYADDIILAGNNLEEIVCVKQLLCNKFSIKDLGELKFFWGLEIARSKLGISISQRKYALEPFSDVGCLASEPSCNPMDSSQGESQPYEDVFGQRRLVGRLLDTTSRLDICFAVQ